jgi:predicted nucleic acid-binding Zn ribbon protein
MPLYQGTCPEHGVFERLVPSIIAGPPVKINCPAKGCKRRVPRDVTAPVIRFSGSGFQTPRPAPPKADTGTAKVKRNRY